ncbi:MAG TPA: ABC transporter permease, partial [Blastocatellia bacterium]
PAETEVWMTRNSDPPNTSRTAHNWPVIGRLRPGVTLDQARADVSLISKQLRQTYGEKMDAVDFALVPLQQFLTRNVREGLLLLLGAVGLLLLVACANVSNLLLAQFTARQREFTVRAALGASRWRLVRQLIAENLLVTLPAALLGVLLASYGVELLLLLDHGTLPQVNRIEVDNRVALFAGGLSVLIAVLLGMLPAFRFGKQDLPGGLKDGRGQSADATSQRLRGALVVTQIGLTLVLLTGAGLLGRSFIKLLRTDPGFKTENAVAMTLSLPSTISRQEDERLRQFYVQLLERVGQMPGVTAAGGINALPLADRGANGRFLIDDNPALRGEADYRVASGGYFPAMGMRLLQGRLFDGTDTVNSPHSAVISQSLAAKYWPKGDAIGQRIQFGNMDTDKRLLNVVGIVSDVRDAGLDTEANPTVYSYSLQRPQWWQVSRLSIVVRATTDPQSLIPAMRGAVASLRSDVPLRFRTLEGVFSSSLDQRRFSLMLYGVFAAVALVIAAIGIYGVISYSVAQRTQEIGIRMALGAQRRDVLRLVIRQGMKLALIGVSVGLAGALAMTGLLKSMLYGVSVTDPLTFALIALLFTGVALLACWIPARRATRVDPMEALRCE